jgi:hypothetical protein
MPLHHQKKLQNAKSKILDPPASLEDCVDVCEIPLAEWLWAFHSVDWYFVPVYVARWLKGYLTTRLGGHH